MSGLRSSREASQAIERFCLVGDTGKTQRLAQFAMFAQPNLGLPNGPVFVTHQTENRQQLGLFEPALAETTSVARKHRLANLQDDASKRQESNFGHRPSCLRSKQQFQPIWNREFSLS